MSTIEDFENAPIGSTATSPDGWKLYRRETRTQGGADWVIEYSDTAICAYGDDLAHHGYVLDPWPEPEPDWLDAPAVMARVEGWVSCPAPKVFARENKTGTQWLRDTKVYRWDELRDVTPLYPKETK